ncbi:MAG: trehalose-phosphatase [Thermoprotei archaeon]|nr:MAG: trehalose-phosphatase [Thermoprotei archaeon]
MPLYLFRHWLEVEGTLRASLGVFLMLDYDGTLTPIASRPEEAVLSGDVKALLRKLALSKWVKLAIISGRGLDQLKGLVGLEEAYYAGLHGMVIEGPGLRFMVEGLDEARRAVEEVKDRLNDRLSGVPGVLIEDKGFSVAVHYRLVPRGYVKRVARELNAILASSEGLRALRGKKVVELLPDVDWDKGKAALLLLSKAGGTDRVPVYVGDDETDEAAFKALKHLGITVVVGAKKRSTAKFYVRGVEEVVELLKKVYSIVAG